MKPQNKVIENVDVFALMQAIIIAQDIAEEELTKDTQRQLDE